MSKTTLITLTAILLLVLVFGGWLFSNSSTVLQKQTNQTTQIGQVGELPVNPTNDKVVKSMGLTYVFGANLRSINKNNPEKPWLSTNLNEEPGVPRFYVTSTTKIFFETQGKELPATLAAFSPGQRLWITGEYDLTKKTWEITKVIIKDSSSQ